MFIVKICKEPSGDAFPFGEPYLLNLLPLEAGGEKKDKLVSDGWILLSKEDTTHRQR